MLIDEFYEPCELYNEVRRPDGEGGFYTSYEPAGEFQAAVIEAEATLQMKADKLDVFSGFYVTTDENVILKYPDVIKRKETGQVLRITTDGNNIKIPNLSTIRRRQVKAERWELTND